MNDGLQIIKVQWPLLSTGEPTCLLYNEDRSIYAEVSCSFWDGLPALKFLLEQRKKIYVLGEIINSNLAIDGIVPLAEEPDW